MDTIKFSIGDKVHVKSDFKEFDGIITDIDPHNACYFVQAEGESVISDKRGMNTSWWRARAVTLIEPTSSTIKNLLLRIEELETGIEGIKHQMNATVDRAEPELSGESVHYIYCDLINHLLGIAEEIS